ncbi:MAG: hypothetical protein AAF387_12430, partial [Pseudomonadota bacterium]
MRRSAHLNLAELACEALAAGRTVLTPTARMAAIVRQAFTEKMIDDGVPAWPSAQVLPWRVWFAEFYARIHPEAPSLLSYEQSLLLWEQVIGEEPTLSIQQVGQFTRLAADAWASAHLWQLPFATLFKKSTSHEATLFGRWQQKYRDRLKALSFLDTYQAALDLVDKMPGDAGGDFASSSDQQLLLGYAALPPLLKSLAPQCWALVEFDEPNDSDSIGQSNVIAFDSAAEEIESAIRWAVEQKLANPKARVAIALSNPTLMQNHLQDAQRRFRFSECGDAAQAIANSLNESKKQTLSNTKLVQSALRILNLGAQVEID